MPSPNARSTAPAAPARVCDARGMRSLEFSPGEVQSQMRLDRPDDLVLAYARAMMLFVLFQRRPSAILMVGLGGGSLLKYCYRHLPGCRITVIELRADVIALRQRFAIPPDDARLRVIEDDACRYLARTGERFDVVLIDGFDVTGLPPALGSARFYADCRRVLRAHGVLVANMFNYDARAPGMLRRLALVFGGPVLRPTGVAGNNVVALCLRSDSATPARLFGWLARHKGLGVGWLNRVLVAATLACVGWRGSRRGRPN